MIHLCLPPADMLQQLLLLRGAKNIEVDGVGPSLLSKRSCTCAPNEILPLLSSFPPYSARVSLDLRDARASSLLDAPLSYPLPFATHIHSHCGAGGDFAAKGLPSLTAEPVNIQSGRRMFGTQIQSGVSFFEWIHSLFHTPCSDDTHKCENDCANTNGWMPVRLLARALQAAFTALSLWRCRCALDEFTHARGR